MTPDAFAKSSATLGYAQNDLDRLANFRDDADFIEEQRRHASARTFVVAGDAILLRDGPASRTPWYGFDQTGSLGPLREVVFLGRDSVGPAFAALLEGGAPAEHSGLHTADLRALAVDADLPAADLGALAEGKALLNWHAHHRFCPNCGNATRLAGGGWRRECPACGAHHFPRTDPVVIMLAVDGDRCLMGRQPRFPPKMYSCLAGFVEPGETIEAAVAREIGEEAGIAIGRVTYLGTQPWPFPSSLMIGCLAEATSTAVRVDDLELEDARWFSRGEVQQMLDGTHPDGLQCPTPMAIAHHIVKAWMEE